MSKMKVAVIGGGPAGLTTLKFLSEAHKYFPIPRIEVRLFEAEPAIGGTFVYRVYEDAELVSSKYLTAFSDFRLPSSAPDFLTPNAYVQYLKDYVTFFKLWDFIECNTKVENIRRDEHSHGHIISIRNVEGISEWHCDAVAVCTGLNVSPQIPEIKGIEKVPKVLHSSHIKSKAQFGENTNVVILGAGETGMDMAHLAVTAPTKSVALCHRDGFFCAPKIIPTPVVARNGYAPAKVPPNKPVDTSVASLFDTAYVHPILQRSQLLWIYYDKWIKNMHWLISGTEEGPDQWVGHMSKSRKYVDSSKTSSLANKDASDFVVLFCKSDRALPYMNVGHRSTSWINRIRSKIMNVPIENTRGKKIDVLTWPTRLDQFGYMHFDSPHISKDTSLPSKVKPDVVVYATGYQRKFDFLGTEYPDISQCDVRGIFKSTDVTFGFIGIVRPSLGAIPPLAELQAQLWVLRVVQEMYPREVPRQLDARALKSYNLDYGIHPRGSYDFFNDKRAVDHESYAYQLALDIGSAPCISHVMSKGWKLFFTWAMGPNFNTKFRLVGPWKCEETAEEIMKHELFNVVQRSGGYIYLFTYTLIPFFIFGIMSIQLYVIFGVWGMIKELGKRLGLSGSLGEKR